MLTRADDADVHGILCCASAVEAAATNGWMISQRRTAMSACRKMDCYELLVRIRQRDATDARRRSCDRLTAFPRTDGRSEACPTYW